MSPSQKSRLNRSACGSSSDDFSSSVWPEISTVGETTSPRKLSSFPIWKVWSELSRVEAQVYAAKVRGCPPSSLRPATGHSNPCPRHGGLWFIFSACIGVPKAFTEKPKRVALIKIVFLIFGA
jgi:hypothetical protein